MTDNKTLHFMVKSREDKIKLLEQINKNQKANMSELKKKLKAKEEVIEELKQKIDELSVIKRLSEHKSYAEMMKSQGRW